jgi:glycosyltransferase involved in cell wall biosynthesis
VRILILTASLPYPPASGGALRVYGILHGLHAAGHHVTLMAFHDGDTAPDQTPLARLCDRVITLPTPVRSKRERIIDLLTTPQADIARRFYSAAFATELTRLAQECDFDLIQFEAIEIACYLPIIKALNLRAKLVFDTFNAEADLQRRIYEIERANLKRLPAAAYSWMQSRRIARYEGDLCRMADAVIAVSPEDAALLDAYRPDKRVSIVPSGIFVDDYAATEATNLPKNALVFTGKMDYRPNMDAVQWFAAEILPSIPNAHLVIVGQKPHPIIAHLAQQPNITLTGFVPSVQPYLQAADVYIAPLRMGSGTRLKLLEAMASGCAIVATSTAASGLSDTAKSAMVIADTETDFAQAVIQLLGDTPRRNTLGEQARAAVRAEYDWSVLIPRLLNVYQEIM